MLKLIIITFFSFAFKHLGDAVYTENRYVIIPYFYSKFVLPKTEDEIIYRFNKTKYDGSYQKLIQNGI